MEVRRAIGRRKSKRTTKKLKKKADNDRQQKPGVDRWRMSWGIGREEREAEEGQKKTAGLLSGLFSSRREQVHFPSYDPSLRVESLLFFVTRRNWKWASGAEKKDRDRHGPGRYWFGSLRIWPIRDEGTV